MAKSMPANSNTNRLLIIFFIKATREELKQQDKLYKRINYWELTIMPAGTKNANTLMSIKYDGQVGGWCSLTLAMIGIYLLA